VLGQYESLVRHSSLFYSHFSWDAILIFDEKRQIGSNFADTFIQKFEEISLILFYQSYWHGLFPLWIKSTYYANLQSVGFNLEPIQTDTFINFMGKLIFKESFKKIITIS